MYKYGYCSSEIAPESWSQEDSATKLISLSSWLIFLILLRMIRILQNLNCKVKLAWRIILSRSHIQNSTDLGAVATGLLNLTFSMKKVNEHNWRRKELQTVTFSFSALFMAVSWVVGTCSPSSGGPFSKSAEAIASKHFLRCGCASSTKDESVGMNWYLS